MFSLTAHCWRGLWFPSGTLMLIEVVAFPPPCRNPAELAGAMSKTPSASSSCPSIPGTFLGTPCFSAPCLMGKKFPKGSATAQAVAQSQIICSEPQNQGI